MLLCTRLLPAARYFATDVVPVTPGVLTAFLGIVPGTYFLPMDSVSCQLCFHFVKRVIVFAGLVPDGLAADVVVPDMLDLIGEDLWPHLILPVNDVLGPVIQLLEGERRKLLTSLYGVVLESSVYKVF